MSQSLLFRSAVWFHTANRNTNFMATVSRNPFYSGLLFDSENMIARTESRTYSVAIPSIQVCCLIPISAFALKKIPVPLGRNPFYSGLLFDSLLTYLITSDIAVLSQSLLFRSAVWFVKIGKSLITVKRLVAIPSIQVCCLIHRRLVMIYKYGDSWVAIPSIQVCCLILVSCLSFGSVMDE